MQEICELLTDIQLEHELKNAERVMDALSQVRFKQKLLERLWGAWNIRQ